MNRLRFLFGALIVLFAVLVPTGSAAASEAPVSAATQMGPVTPEGAIVLVTGFYCPGATAPASPCMPCRPDVGSASCPMGYKYPSVQGTLYIQITNHANYGEHCFIWTSEGGHAGNEFIDQGNNSEIYMGRTHGSGVGYQARCQRRAATGDAGIGGYIWLHT